MSTWLGWQSDLLVAAQLPDTRLNRSFLTGWHNSQQTPCVFNPVFISYREPSSTACRTDSRSGKVARNYISVGSAKSAFVAQIHDGTYAHLLAVLKTGDPYTASQDDVGYAVQELGYWGSYAFGLAYFQQMQQPPKSASAPQALNGWAALRKTVNQDMPAALGNSQHIGTQTLRTLTRAHKVRQ